MENTETKVCSKCLKEIDIINFHIDKRNGKRENTCKFCKSEHNKKGRVIWRQNRAEKLKNIQTLVCKECKCEKDKSKFLLMHNVCRECQNAETRKRGRKNTEKYYESRKKRMKDDPSGTILSRCKERAKKKGIEVNLTKEDIIVPSVCPVLGIPLFLGDDIACDNSYSLDRIDNTKGYVKGNVRVISNRANNIKNVGNAEEHRKVAEYIDKNLPIDNGDYSI